jgi:hypothetical protein
MSSRALATYDRSRKDVEELLTLHAERGGDLPGRRWDPALEVLNKSAIVLITALWEAYCEDVVAEALEHILQHGSLDALPKSLRQQVAEELKKDLNELAVWQLAGDGWRSLLLDRLAKMREDRNWNFNSPSTAKVNELFKRGLGMADVSACWQWNKMKQGSAEKKLNAYIRLRGDIAHRGKASSGGVRKSQVTGYNNHVSHLVTLTDAAVDTFVEQTTGGRLSP